MALSISGLMGHHAGLFDNPRSDGAGMAVIRHTGLGQATASNETLPWNKVNGQTRLLRQGRQIHRAALERRRFVRVVQTSVCDQLSRIWVAGAIINQIEAATARQRRAAFTCRLGLNASAVNIDPAR